MKCYKLIFSLDGQLHNKGSYIMSSILFIFIFLFFWYCIKGNKVIDKYILDFISRNRLYTNEKKKVILTIRIKKKIIKRKN